jgi:hydrogenase expression/formation protein HypC
MCLGVPMKITEINGFRAKAEVSNVVSEIGLQLIPEVKIGDYVIVHAGFGIEILDEKTALETLEIMKQMGLQ